MIAFLIARGLSPNIAKLIGYVVLPLVVAGLLYWYVSSRIENFGQRKYDEGVAATDAKWVEAGNRLKEQATESATRADDKAAARLDEFEAQVEDERKAVNEAQRNGDSALDVLFGG